MIIQLCTQAGTEMEDAVTSALTMGGLDDKELVQDVNRLEASSAKIAALIAAAKALADLSS
ncbi:MAG: hypothetical protein AAGE86_00775 [Pseudomonadota bacterium]